jgi:UDP-glucuronate decarboxylase
MENKKTILITGGAGFIGSHLCEKYLREGNRVIALDNLQTTFSEENIEQFKPDPNFSFVKHDITKPINFDVKLDWILNFACPAQCVNLQYDPVHTLKTSVHGVINMLELARKHGARIMQASTSEIYGHEPKMPQVETDCGEVNTLGPRACYDEGKRVSETLMMDYYRQYGTDIKIIRIFNTYGPRMYVRDGRVMSNFIIPAIQGKDVKIYGDGSYTRSFQYVDDLVRGIDKMMRKENFTGPVNLGNPHELTIKELADTIIRKTGGRSKIVYASAVTDDPVRRQPSIELAKRELDWEPKVSLEEGIEKTIEYFKKVEMPDKKILVFATTFYPDHGPAESALMELARSMPDTELHVITSKFKPDRLIHEKLDNLTIWRVGLGNKFDKYLLPFLGYRKAKELSLSNKYRFAWSIMASYGALAAVMLKMANNKINFLISFDLEADAKRGAFKARVLAPVFRYIFSKADSVYLSDASLEAKAKFFAPNSEISTASADNKELVDQVRFTFARLLNKQEHKLDRPR